MNINSAIRNDIYNETRSVVSEIQRCLKVMVKRDINLKQKAIAYNRLHHILLPQLEKLRKEINAISD